MIIVTPALGWPEPRPQQLITGDRAVQLVDATTSSALQKAGVKLVTISSVAYQKMVDELVPEVIDGIDPETGKLQSEVIPTYLSPEALADIDIRGFDGKIEEAYLPVRLSTTALNAALNAANSTKIETDPDGVPVIIGGESTTNSQNIDTLTVTDLTAADAHADNLTATIADITSMEVDQVALVGFTGTQPGSPAANRYRVYIDNLARPVWKDSAGILRRVSNKRIVTSWPANADSQIGDEAYHSTTGEHRIYKGTTLGWRQASPFEVSTLTDRNAITGLYPGYRVFCTFGAPQEHYWDGTAWRGTKSWRQSGSAVNTFTGINDVGVRRWGFTNFVDPGFAYHLDLDASVEVITYGSLGRVGFQWRMVDTNTTTGQPGTTNNKLFALAFDDTGQSGQRYSNVHVNAKTWGNGGVQTGNRSSVLELFVNANANATVTGYAVLQEYDVMPA